MSPLLPRRLLSAQSDERLVALARAGHERAFEVLVHRYRRPLLRYCQRLLLTGTGAEDALQQAWISAWQALSRGVEVQEPRAWLYRIVHNQAVSALRRSGYDYAELHESLSGATSPADDLDRRIAVREALAGIASLPDVQREVLLRSAVEGQSHQEVASALGLSDGAVRGLIYRARNTLRAAATVFTPSPVAAWAASGGRVAPASVRVAEVLGFGSAGVSGAMVKAGVVALTAGGLAAGGLLAHVHRHRSGRTDTTAVVAGRGPHDATAPGLPPVLAPPGASRDGVPTDHPARFQGVEGGRRRLRLGARRDRSSAQPGGTEHRADHPLADGQPTPDRVGRSSGGSSDGSGGGGHRDGGGGHGSAGGGGSGHGGGGSGDGGSTGGGPGHGPSDGGSASTQAPSGPSASGRGGTAGSSASGSGSPDGGGGGGSILSSGSGGGSGGGGGSRDSSGGSSTPLTSSSSGTGSLRTDGSGSAGSDSSSTGP